MALPTMPARRAAPRRAPADDLTLEPSPESRLDGAPALSLPGYAEAVDAVSIQMLSEAGLPNTPEYRQEIRPQAEAYVQQSYGKGKQRTVPPAEQAQYNARDQRMADWARDYYEQTGAPQDAADAMYDSLAPGSPPPAASEVDPFAQYSPDERAVIDQMILDGEIVQPPGFTGQPRLTPEQREMVQWKAGVRQDRRAESERYGPNQMSDEEVSAAADANQPYTEPSAREFRSGAAQLVNPGITLGWSPPGAVVPRQPLPGQHGPMIPPPLQPGDPGIPLPQAGSGPMAIDGPAILPSLFNQVDSRLGAHGPDAPMPGETDPRYQTWKDERQGRRDRENRFHSSDAQRESRIERLATRAGISYDEAEAMVDRERKVVRPPQATNAEAAGVAAGGVPGGIAGPPVASGMNPLDAAGTPMTPAERRAEFAPLRKAVRGARVQDTLDRRAKVSQHARLAGGQPTGGIGGSRAAVEWMNEGWGRTDDLLARLSQEGISDWERAGIISQLAPRADTSNPTPLGVDAVGAANTMRMMNANAFADGGLFNNSLRGVQAANAEANLPLDVRADRERDANNGVLPASSPAGQAVLSEIATRIVGNSYATQDEYDRAVDAAVAQGVPRPEAEDYMRRHSQTANSGFWGWMLGSPPGIGSPAGSPAPAPPPVTPREARGG